MMTSSPQTAPYQMTIASVIYAITSLLPGRRWLPV